MARILIIEDDDQFGNMLKDALSRAGYEALLASDGKEGIQLYREQHPDLIITDVIMPEKDGAEVIFDLQREFPNVKIIAMTGGGHGDAQTYLNSIKMYSKVEYGFEKPFAISELLQAVKASLED